MGVWICARAVGEQAGADQNSGVVVHKESRAADFDADGEHFFAMNVDNQGLIFVFQVGEEADCRDVFWSCHGRIR